MSANPTTKTKVNDATGENDEEALVGGNESAVNLPISEIKSLSSHPPQLQNEKEDAKSQHLYISPSDNIMSPCTAKLNALRNSHATRAKPRSLFMQAASSSAKASSGDILMGSRDVPKSNDTRPAKP